MNPIETDEGVNDGEESQDNELMAWLQSNRLLKAKQKFIEYEVTMDDLKAIDLKLELNDFITNDLKLSGIWATKARKAIIELQQKCGTTQTQQPQQQIVRTIILSKEEDEAMTAINIKCNETTEYMQQLNNDINILINTGKENDKKINEFENEVINKVKIRMNALRQELNKEINIKQQQISSHLNKIKSYHSTLSIAQKTQQKILNDVNYDTLKRKTKIQEIYANIAQNKTMDNKQNFNPLITAHFNESKTYNFIKQIGTVQNHKYPDPPSFMVKNIEHRSATIELNELKQSLQCVLEIDKCADNEDDDEKKADWQQLATLKNTKSYKCTNLDNNTAYKLRGKSKNEYGWSRHSEIIKFKTKNKQSYHPPATEPYHPRDLTKDVTRHQSTSTVKAHSARWGAYSWTCCDGNRSSRGCKEKHACCSEWVQKDVDGKSTNGCKWYYPCCKNDSDHSGCKKKYLCCGKDESSKGCQIKYG